jgi:hypothetical protein
MPEGQDKRSAAGEARAPSPLWRSPAALAIAAVVLALAGAAGGAFLPSYLHPAETKTDPAGGGPAAAPAKQAPTDAKAALDRVAAYAQGNAEEHDRVIRTYEAFAAAYAQTPLAKKASAEVEVWRRKKKVHAAKTTAEKEEQRKAEELRKQEEKRKAEETARRAEEAKKKEEEARKTREREEQARKQKEEKARREREEAARKERKEAAVLALAEFQKSFRETLAAEGPGKAVALAQACLKDPKYAGARGEIESAVADGQRILRVRRAAIGSIDGLKGRRYTFRNRKGVAFTGKVSGCKKDSVFLEISVGGATAQTGVKLADLSHKTIASLATRALDPKKADDVLDLGVYDLYAGNVPAAEKHFADARELGANTAHYVARIAATRKEVAEAAAAKSYDALPRAGGLPAAEDAAALTVRIRTTRFTARQVRDIKRELKALGGELAETDVARKHATVIDLLGSVRPNMPLKLDQAVLDKALKRLQSLAGQKDVKFHRAEIRGDKVVIHLNGQKKLVKITPLAGLPIEDLNLQNTGVTDLSALRGMPLKVLNISRTQATDLSPVRDAPLEHLLMIRSKVARLPQFTSKTLKHVDLNHSIVADISGLREQPLETLRMIGTKVTRLPLFTSKTLRHVDLNDSPVSDISGLQGQPLVHLHIVQTKVADLSPLKKSRLVNLNVSLTPVRDLFPLRGLPLHALDIRQTQVTSLLPLKDLQLKVLHAQGLKGVDFGPVEKIKGLTIHK